MHHRKACVSTVLVALGICSSAAAQDEPPTVSEDAGGPAQEAKTDAAAKAESGARVEGWSPGLAVGASFNLVDSRSVVGQQDGTSFTFGGGLDAALELNSGMHEWRNGVGVSLGMTRTPALDEFIKTNDGLSFESIYLLHVIEIFGPFARFALNTQMLDATDVQPSAIDYVVANLDGTTDNFTGRRLALTDPFQPLTLKQSVGVFVQPLRERIIELEARAGLGAQETFAEGGLAITDDDATDPIEVTELDDSFQVGAEVVLNIWGFFDEQKRIAYTAGVGALFPFVTSDLPEGDDRGLGELVVVEANLGLNVKILDFASLTYKLDVMRLPLLVDETQVSNSLLLTIGGAWGSKAPEPPPEKCPCPDPDAEVPPPPAEPGAAGSGEPGAGEPGPVEPGPVEPGPVEPGPVEPGPSAPAPAEPPPAEPPTTTGRSRARTSTPGAPEAMMKRIVVLVPLLCMPLVSAIGCIDHFSTQDAYSTCEVLLDGVVTTQDADEESFTMCVACYEDCGTDCEQSKSSPPTFTCPN